MSAPPIDETILSSVGPRWRKVAMVIAEVTDKMSDDLPQGDEGCQVVAQRIESLVRDGRLASQGNMKNWRFSEVRWPDWDTALR